MIHRLSSGQRRRAQRLFGEEGTPRIAIIGGGFGGIGLSAKLKQAGIHTFTIFERVHRLTLPTAPRTRARLRRGAG